MSEVRFDERVVLITGAAGSLGRAYARAFAARGARLVLNDTALSDGRGESADVKSLVTEVAGLGGEAIANEDSVENGARIVQAALDHFGRLDAVISNAGILRDRAFHKMSDEEWDAVLRVHLTGTFQVCRAAWPHMRSRKFGRIVVTSSAAGLYGNFGQANYSAAKLGIVGLAQTLAIEGASCNVLVNSIAPLAASRLTAGVMSPPMLEALRPELVAPVVLYLASDSCSSTGQLFEVGGGCIARLRWERSEALKFDAGLTAEMVADSWHLLEAFRGADHPQRVEDSLALVARHCGVPLYLTPQ